MNEPAIQEKQISIYAVDPEQVDEIWDLVWPVIERAQHYAQGEYSKEDIHQRLLDKRMHMLVAVDDAEEHMLGAVTCEILDYPACRAFHVMSLAGENLIDWIQPLEAKILEGAEHTGCDRITADCRPEMARFLEKHLRFKPAYQRVVRRLD